MLSISKDCEVEVFSKDKGFRGSWYRAILLENPTKSGCKKLQVRYMTLVDEDYSSLLTESVEQSLIRPVPPNDLNGEEVDFEEGSVVDAVLKDGWWTGIVTKKLADHKYLVYFDNPQDLIQFERKQLRAHLDWVDSRWVRPKTKELSKSMFSPGTMVEVSCKINKLEAAWVPALIVKEIDEQKFIVKRCDKSFSWTSDEMKTIITVDICNIRPIPPPIFVEEYQLMDLVDAFSGSEWRQAEVRGILSEKRYVVSYLATMEESVFKHSDLRPSKEWKDGVWHQGSKLKPGDKTPSDGKRKKPVAFETTLSEVNELCQPKRKKIITSSSTAAKPISPTAFYSKRNAAITSKSTKKHTNETVDARDLPSNQMAGDVMNGDAMVTDNISKEDPTMVLPLEKRSPIWKVVESMDVFKTEKQSPHFNPLLETREEFREGSALDEMVNIPILLEGVKNMQIHTPNRTLERLKECRQSTEKQTSETVAAMDLPSNQMVDDVKNDDATVTDNISTMVLPFEKRSPIWKMVESMDVFKIGKQSPHFSPLLEIREEFREGSAVGEMVNYSILLERVKNLQIHTPKRTLESLKQCFHELAKYGFDVTKPISRINRLFPLKDEQVSRTEDLKAVEKKMSEEVTKKKKVEEYLREIKHKILEIQSQEAELKEKNEDLDKEIVEMMLGVAKLDKEIQDVELEFQMSMSAPW